MVFSRWTRQTIKDYIASSNEYWSCEYYVDSGRKDNKISRVKNLKDLQKHIRNSSEKTAGKEHDRLEREDGWYDPNWAQSEASIASRQDIRVKENATKIGGFGLKYSNAKELLKGNPDPSHPGVVIGGPYDMALPQKYEGFVSSSTLDNAPPTAPIGSEFSSVISSTKLDDLQLPSPPPKNYDDFIESIDWDDV